MTAKIETGFMQLQALNQQQLLKKEARIGCPEVFRRSMAPLPP